MALAIRLPRLLAIATLFTAFSPAQPALSDHTAAPASVTIAGNLQDEHGCPGDWQPECAATFLGNNADGIWRSTFTLPAGSYEYKAALNGTWDENYGAGGVQDGPNIPLNLGDATDVKFYYDHKSHWITDDVNSAIAVAVGDFQSALGCPGDWQPWLMRLLSKSRPPNSRKWVTSARTSRPSFVTWSI